MNNKSIKSETELTDERVQKAIDDIDSGKYIVHEDLVKKLNNKH